MNESNTGYQNSLGKQTAQVNLNVVLNNFHTHTHATPGPTGFYQAVKEEIVLFLHNPFQKTEDTETVPTYPNQRYYKKTTNHYPS